MTDTILHSDLARIPERRESVFGRCRWRLWVLLSELGLIGFGVAVLYWPVFTVANVTYEGPADWEGEVRSVVTLPSDGNILHFIPDDAVSQIDARFAGRADAQVRVDLPNRISIRLTPYAPRLASDGGIGIACDGSILLEAVENPDLPFWRPGIDWEGSMPLSERAKRAAGTWDELAGADRRYELTTREWQFDPEYGWTSTAVDGKTKLHFGNTLIGPRARFVSQLLSEDDTLLAKPVMIDARFAGQLLLSAIPDLPRDSAKSDSAVTDTTTHDALVEGERTRLPRGTRGEPALKPSHKSESASQSSLKGRT
jgi:hypothetical protein